MTEGDLLPLVRQHLHGPKGCPKDWHPGRDVKIIRMIQMRRPAETLEDLAAAIQGIGVMRDEGWWGPQSATMQFTMRIFFGRTKLDHPYYTLAKSKYFKSLTSGTRRGTWLADYLRPLEGRMRAR